MSIITRISRRSPAIPDWVTWDLNSLITMEKYLRYEDYGVNINARHRRKDVIAEQVRKRGYSFSQVAREYDAPIWSVSEGARGLHRLGEVVLADFLGVPVEVLFPENWDPRSPLYEKKQGARQARTWKAKRRKLLRRLRMWLCRRLRCAAS